MKSGVLNWTSQVTSAHRRSALVLYSSSFSKLEIWLESVYLHEDGETCGRKGELQNDT